MMEHLLATMMDKMMDSEKVSSLDSLLVHWTGLDQEMDKHLVQSTKLKKEKWLVRMWAAQMA